MCFVHYLLYMRDNRFDQVLLWQFLMLDGQVGGCLVILSNV